MGMRRPDPRWIRSRLLLRTAAIRLAARAPIAQVSMGEVATEAGVSRSTAYLHAASAAELLEDALRSELDLFRERRLSRIRSHDVGAASDAIARDVIGHVERHAEVYRRGLADGDLLPGMLREQFADSVRLLLREHDLAEALAPADASDALVEDLVARSIAEATVAQIAVWVAQPAPRDVEVFMALNRELRPAWWPNAGADVMP